MAAKIKRSAHTKQHARQRQRTRRSQRSHKRRRERPSLSNRQSLRRLGQWLLPDDSIFASVCLHGNTRWLPRSLVWLALCWCLVDARHLVDAFDEALQVCSALAPCSLTTYQGFMAALVTWSSELLPLLRRVLHTRMQQINSPHGQLGGWVPIAFDGSRSTAPRTQANEAAFCAAHHGQGTTARYRKKKSKGMRRRRNERHKPQPPPPQTWVTLMWHVGLRLPWTWRLGPSNSSERAHVMDMVAQEKFPAKALFCGDAGFVGYPLWSALIDRGYQFVVRVGANVTLLSEQTEFVLDAQHNGEHAVLCWPKQAMQDNKKPLRLRLLRVDVGQTKMWLLTSVRDEQRLSRQMATQLYQRRWGIEVEFRGLKQTLQRARLRCRNDKRLLVELDWSIVALAVVELLALKEQQQHSETTKEAAAQPSKRSLTQALRALRQCWRHLDKEPGAGQDLQSKLRVAVTDGYTRHSSKKARYRHPNPDKKPLGNPKVQPLDAEQRHHLDLFNRRS